MIGDDEIFKQIIHGINSGWTNLNKAEKKTMVDMVEELVEKLGNYHNSYTILKGRSKRKLDPENFISTKEYQEKVRAADEMEKILHDSFIDALNILSRKMKALGLDNSWRGDERIYGLTPQAMRDKTRNWMFKIFREKI